MPSPRRPIAYCLTLAMAVTAAAAAEAPTPSGVIHYVEGTASAPDGHPMYIESHWLYSDNGSPSRLVLYRCPDGKPFARKNLHDAGNPQAPNFEMDDARTGFTEGVRGSHGKRVVFFRNSATANERTAPLVTSPMPVIDAGFDAYIRNHWNTLGKNDSDSIPFVLPSRLGTMDFSVKRQGDTRINGRTARQYRLGVDSIVGFALPHIEVAYDEQTQQLLSFNGLGNVRGTNGKNVDARIVFNPSNNKDVGLTSLESAEKAPLDGQCKIP